MRAARGKRRQGERGPVDVRIVAATNHDLRRDVDSGRFRRDLFYRLDVLSMAVPPLRERLGDIVLLANEFLSRFALRLGRELEPFGPGESAWFGSHPWPGNVRELENLVEKYATLASAGLDRDLLRRLLAFESSPGTGPGEPAAGIAVRRRSLDDMRKDMLRAALAEAGGNCAEAARRLGISRTTAWRWLKDQRQVDPRDVTT